MNIANECKKTAAIILQGAGIAYDRLSAKTVSFQDLARAECVFVTAHGSKAARDVPCWETAKATAREHGFRIQYSWSIAAIARYGGLSRQPPSLTPERTP